MPFIEYGAESILPRVMGQTLHIVDDLSAVALARSVLVTIGTPVDEFLNPERHVILDCIDSLLPHLDDGQLLVLRSTLYPGTTEAVATHLKKKQRHLNVAFCPERIVQGHMSDRMLQWQRIEAMKTLAASSNAKVIMVGGEGKTATTLDIR